MKSTINQLKSYFTGNINEMGYNRPHCTEINKSQLNIKEDTNSECGFHVQ